jgi:hypothetical protein
MARLRNVLLDIRGWHCFDLLAWIPWEERGFQIGDLPGHGKIELLTIEIRTIAMGCHATILDLKPNPKRVRPRLLAAISRLPSQLGGQHPLQNE